jgi:copper chaperone
MKYSVPDMSCGHCTAAIEKSVKSVDPAASVACDLPSRTVEITSTLSNDDLKRAFQSAGYEATAL